MLLISVVIIGIGFLLAYGGYWGIRTGRMEQPQFGSGIREKPPVLEGEAARRLGRLYILIGIVLMAVGVAIGAGNIGVLLAFIGLLGVAGGAYLLSVGWRGIQKREVIFALQTQTRTITNYVRRTRTITHHYFGTPAVVVGVGYLLLGLGFVGCGAVLLFFPHALPLAVVSGVLGFALWLGSDAVASRMPGSAETIRTDSGEF